MDRLSRPAAVWVAGGICLVLLTSACTSKPTLAPAVSAATSSAQPTQSTVELEVPDVYCSPLPLNPATEPDFTGVYAGDFKATYEAACTDLTRQVLADSDFTPADMTAINNAFAQCLMNVGFTQITFDGNGGYSNIPPPQYDQNTKKGQEAVAGLDMQCETNTDWQRMSTLYKATAGNPDRIDPGTILVQCLIRVGLAPQGYTVSQLDADSNAGKYEFANDDPRHAQFIACNNDPAHAK